MVEKQEALQKTANRKYKGGKYKGGMVSKPTVTGRIADVIIILIVVFLAVICLLPMWHTLMASISDPHRLLAHGGVVLFPLGKWSLGGYKLVFGDSSILLGYLNTIYYTVATVGVGFLLNVLGGYALSRKTKLKKFFILFVVITMMFSGGLIPTYMVIDTLGMVGTEWAVILPNATMAIYVIVGMNAFMSVPEATVEAARIDGAGHFRIMFQIMLPQCLSLFVITILNTFVASWNSWLSASIYLMDAKEKWPIQLWIQEMVQQTEHFLEVADPDYNQYLVQYAVIIISVLPIIIAFPFFQKWLERGMVLGGVKE